MLDFNLSSTIDDQLWRRAPARAALPMHVDAYYGRASATTELPGSRRQYRRIRCHGRAAAYRRADVYGVYLVDISPTGIGFYSPVQMFPLDRVRITCDQHAAIEVEIRRCLRTATECYACGGKFIHGPMSPGQYKEFLNDLRN